MKVWVTDPYCSTIFVSVYEKKPRLLDDTIWDGSNGVSVCRKSMRRLIRGTGKHLPRPGTLDILVLNMEVSK